MLITLTSDFGYRDPFVGIMKGVIAGINPDAHMIDLSHDVSPQDVIAGALLLRHSVSYFPRGTIHLAVIDPGVGGARQPLLIECADGFFVGPDNGVLSLAAGARQPKRVIRLSNSGYHLPSVSATFHGRDIFAPVAAYLSLGIPAVAFGESLDTFVRLELPEPRREPRKISGEVLYIDRFGNLFTNISENDLKGWRADRLVLSLGTCTVRGLSSNYAAGARGEPVALINSWGLLEIAVYEGSAQRRLAARHGDKIEVLFDGSVTGGNS